MISTSCCFPCTSCRGHHCHARHTHTSRRARLRPSWTFYRTCVPDFTLQAGGWWRMEARLWIPTVLPVRTAGQTQQAGQGFLPRRKNPTQLLITGNERHGHLTPIKWENQRQHSRGRALADFLLPSLCSLLRQTARARNSCKSNYM